MTITYTIDENDFLIHQLYVASKSERIKKKRLRNRIIIPLLYVALGLWGVLINNWLLAIMLWVLGVLWFFLYPLWERRRYVKHYQAFIKENYKNRVDRIATLALNNDLILAKDEGSESRVLTSELAEINEIPTIIFIRLKGGQSFILPKDKISNIDEVIAGLKELAAHLKIQYVLDEKWEWK